MENSLFEKHIDAMAKFCRGVRSDNQCLFGVDAEGNIVSDENAGADGASLMGEYQEQIQFRGGTSRQDIESRVYGAPGPSPRGN